MFARVSFLTMTNNTGNNVWKLYYFDVYGLAEPIRYLLNYCGIPFDDIRIDYNKVWLPVLKAEMPMQQVPVLEIQGKKYHQHLSICRYIARTNKLCGSTEEEACEMDAIVEDINDIRLEVGKWYKEQNLSLKATMKVELLKQLPFYLGKFESRVAANNGFFVGTKISWVDIYYAAIIESMSKLLKEDLNKNEDYPNLRQAASSVRSHMLIAAYIQSRPNTEI